MSITAAPSSSARVSKSSPATSATHALAGIGMLRELEQPASLFANLTPNWYASIMGTGTGTGIVAVAAASLPDQFRGLHAFGVLVWAAAALLLVALTGATTVHWVQHPETARGHVVNPVMAHFYGAPPMAMMTVGAGTILLGKDVLGLRAAVDLDWLLWTAGTIPDVHAAHHQCGQRVRRPADARRRLDHRRHQDRPRQRPRRALPSGFAVTGRRARPIRAPVDPPSGAAAPTWARRAGRRAE